MDRQLINELVESRMQAIEAQQDQLVEAWDPYVSAVELLPLNQARARFAPGETFREIGHSCPIMAGKQAGMPVLLCLPTNFEIPIHEKLT